MADIKPWLKALNFKEKLGTYELKIKDSTIIVDIENQKIKYPELKEIGRETTINFSQEENFVVLEIIVNLLKQGYKPNQISIEKGYKLGHNTKSGNADVTVDDNSNQPFLIIEAKTYGTEFEKEWKNTLNDGGQLFSYEKQENKAQVLVLYASHIINEKIVSIYHAINLKDNEEYLTTLENPSGYKDAKGGNDKFEIWRDIYKQDFITNGVLEENIEPFKIGKPKTSVNDLKKIDHNEVQKKYNEFATILRKYNIGGRENAFDKLVNLFLAKIVDEEQNSNDLQFNWKGVAQDTYFDLVDRLQRLYQIGMEKFLNEEVSYVSRQDVEDAFRLKKDAAKDAILKYFKKLKYYSNNDFTFLEVYNENLFYQNSQVLVEIIKMLQDIKLKTEDQNQFLGDLFEGFLDSGVKQSEGQFFTPLPIVKFIVSSLPLKEINGQTDVPKIIDYACGAGHFLNEYAEQLKRYIEKDKLQEYYSQIYGIEKEYRLSKVSKVSAFMYGQDNINIVYADALDKNELIKDNSYSVVIANPPYSVKGFLETLSENQRKKYILSNEVDNLDKNNSIELFFIERAKQLLKSEGVAGIIVPSSILSNGNIYSKARKILIENFSIIAIVEFGSKTFGSTGTNTITLFLKKKKYPPKESDNYKYSVERWFANNDVQNIDKDIIYSYCDFVDIEYEKYKELQQGKLEKLIETEMFEEYVEEFSKTSKAKKINEKPIKNKYTEEMKKEEFKKAQFQYIKEIEQEKVTYFSIANSQKNKVIIVKSPSSNNEMKKFLGYEWSKRKGQEGIKYIGVNISDEEMEISKNQAINAILTPLFNSNNLDDNEKINVIIRDNFNEKLGSIPENLKEFVTISSLINMIDFTQTNFDMEIKTNSKKKIEIKSKYPIKKIENIAKIQKGQSITQAQTKDGNIKVVAGGVDYAYLHDTANREANIITISASGANAGFINFWNEPIFASDTTTVQAQTIEETKYIFYFLRSQQDKIFDLARGAAQPHVYPKDIAKFPIPVPPIEIQKEIIEEVDKLEEKYQNSRMKIEEYREEIEKIFKNLDVIEEISEIDKKNGGGVLRFKLSSDDFYISIGKRVLNKELTEYGIPVYSANVFEPFGFIDKDILQDFSKPSVIWGIDGDWMVNSIPQNVPFYPTDHIGVIRLNTDKINYRYLAYKLQKEGEHEGFSRSYRASINQIKKISISVPSIDKQNEAIKRIEEFESKISLEKEKIFKIQEEIKKVLIEKLN